VRLTPLQHQFIDVTPHPVFARLQRPDNRVFRSLKMLRGVFVLEESQQPTWPQLKHSRKCTQLSPIFRHSSQPLVFGLTRLI